MIKIKRKNLWVVLLVFLILYFLYLFIQSTMDHFALLADEKEYKEKIAYETQRRESLLALEKKADSDETIENLARNNLNYLKENEILFIDGDE